MTDKKIVNDWLSSDWPKLANGGEPHTKELMAHARLRKRYDTENARLKTWSDEEKAARDTDNPMKRRLQAAGLNGVGNGTPPTNVGSEDDND